MNEVVIVNPHNNAEKIASMRKQLMEAQSEDVRVIDAATEDIIGNGIGNHKKTAFDADYKAIGDKGKKFVQSILAECGADAVMVQLTAYQTAVREANKRYVSEWENARPALPTHTYVMRLTCTDAALDKVCKAATKEGATDVLFAVPQGDKAVKAICKWFEENV